MGFLSGVGHAFKRAGHYVSKAHKKTVGQVKKDLRRVDVTSYRGRKFLIESAAAATGIGAVAVAGWEMNKSRVAGNRSQKAARKITRQANREAAAVRGRLEILEARIAGKIVPVTPIDATLWPEGPAPQFTRSGTGTGMRISTDPELNPWNPDYLYAQKLFPENANSPGAGGGVEAPAPWEKGDPELDSVLSTGAANAPGPTTPGLPGHATPPGKAPALASPALVLVGGLILAAYFAKKGA
jgi:hypothetical protein